MRRRPAGGRPVPGASASWRGGRPGWPRSPRSALPSGPKWPAKRPSVRAKARKSTSVPSGRRSQSSRRAGLPCSDQRSRLAFAPPRVVGEEGERPRVDGELRLRGGRIVGDAVLGHAGGVGDDDGRAREGVGLGDRPVEVVDVGRRGLGDVDVAVGGEDAAELLARLGPAVEDRSEGRQLRDLAAERCGRGLAAGIRVDLRVEDEDLDVGARGDHPRQGLEADVVHRPVAAERPTAGDRGDLPGPSGRGCRGRPPGRSRRVSWSTGRGTGCTGRCCRRRCCSRSRRRCPSTPARGPGGSPRRASGSPSPRRSRSRSRRRRDSRRHARRA